jgi:hypothetical protein
MACRSKRGGLNRSTPTRPKQSAQEKAATTSFTASAYWKFESSPLQRRVGCELGFCKGGSAGFFPRPTEIVAEGFRPHTAFARLVRGERFSHIHDLAEVVAQSPVHQLQRVGYYHFGRTCRIGPQRASRQVESPGGTLVARRGGLGVLVS